MAARDSAELLRIRPMPCERSWAPPSIWVVSYLTGIISVGIEMTTLDCTGVLLSIQRPGAITAEFIWAVTGQALGVPKPRTRFSGSLESH
jgi:hypothetical protein